MQICTYKKDDTENQREKQKIQDNDVTKRKKEEKKDYKHKEAY